MYDFNAHLHGLHSQFNFLSGAAGGPLRRVCYDRGGFFSSSLSHFFLDGVVLLRRSWSSATYGGLP